MSKYSSKDDVVRLLRCSRGDSFAEIESPHKNIALVIHGLEKAHTHIYIRLLGK